MSALLFLHRWIGVVLAAFMTLWLGSGLLIVLTDPPATDRAAQLAHADFLAQQPNWIGPEETWRRGGEGALPAEARLVRKAGAPYWLFKKPSGEVVALSATDAAPHVFSADDAGLIAADWLAAPGEEESARSAVVYLGQGEAPPYIRNAEGLGPFHTLAVDDGWGTHLIVSSRSGDVLASAGALRRAFYYAGSWIHTFHPLDFLGENRRLVLAWAGGLAAAASLSGLIVGWIRWRPGLFGRPTYSGGRRQPYRRFWLATHFWTGLIGGTFALLWALSGFLSTNPGGLFSPANLSPAEIAAYVGAADPRDDFRLPSHDVADEVELSWRRLGDQTILVGVAADGDRVPLRAADDRFAPDAIPAALRRLIGYTPIAAQTEISQYDSYYYRNRRQSAIDRPLPALKIDLADAGGTRLYIDPIDGRILLRQDASRRAYRWLFNGLHHWDFGFLAARPAWLAWELTWVPIGLVLAISAFVLGWRRLQVTGLSARLNWQAKWAARKAKTSPHAEVSGA
jgi:uncharacterized iron-regulated membrane protein